jgi:hypothetical protein
MSNPITVEKLTLEKFNEFISLWHFSANALTPEVVQGYFSRSLFSYIFLEDNVPVGAFGLVPLWNGVGECWFMSTTALERYPIFLIKTFRKLTDMVLQNGLHRVQIMVHDTPALNKWATTLGFTKEGVLRKYGIDQKDNAVYSKIWDMKS